MAMKIKNRNFEDHFHSKENIFVRTKLQNVVLNDMALAGTLPTKSQGTVEHWCMFGVTMSIMTFEMSSL